MPPPKQGLSIRMRIRRHMPDGVTALYGVAVTAGALTGGLWAILGIGGALVMAAALLYAERAAPWPRRDVAALAFLSLAVMAVLNLVSTQPGLSWAAWGKLATIFLPLLLLSSPRLVEASIRPALFRFLPWGLAAGAAGLGLELALGGPLLHALKGADASLTQYNRGLSWLVLMAFPALAVLAAAWNRRESQEGAGVLSVRFWDAVRPLAPAVGFLVALLVVAGLTESRASKLALVVALPVMALARFSPLRAARVLALLPFAFVVWPFAAQKVFLACHACVEHLPPSWHARMEIWDYMSYRIMEKPWLGWGLGASHTLPFQAPHGGMYVYTVVPASHPHNVFVQLWVELGMPGLVLGIAFALLMLRKAVRLDARLSPFALGAWAAAFSLSLAAYDFWTDSFFAAMALTGLAFALLDREARAGAGELKSML